MLFLNYHSDFVCKSTKNVWLVIWPLKALFVLKVQIFAVQLREVQVSLASESFDVHWIVKLLLYLCLLDFIRVCIKVNRLGQLRDVKACSGLGPSLGSDGDQLAFEDGYRIFLDLGEDLCQVVGFVEEFLHMVELLVRSNVDVFALVALK